MSLHGDIPSHALPVGQLPVASSVTRTPVRTDASRAAPHVETSAPPTPSPQTLTRPVTETPALPPSRFADAATVEHVSRGNLTPRRGAPVVDAQVIEQLQSRSKQARASELSQYIAAGRYSRGATYRYTTGPDGQRYLSASAMQFDMAPFPDDPDATVAKMQAIKRAALAAACETDCQRRIVARADAEIEAARKAMAVAERSAAPAPAESNRLSYDAHGRLVVPDPFARPPAQNAAATSPSTPAARPVAVDTYA